MSGGTLLTAECLRHAERTALISGRTSVSYRALHERVRRQARAWRKWGLRAGDRVAVLVPVSMVLAEILLSLFASGMTAVLADPAGNIVSFLESFRRARVRALAGTRKAHLLRIVSPFLRGLPLKVVCGRAFPGERSWAGAAAQEPLEASSIRAEERPVLLTFTTGSSGAPKAVARTLGFLQVQQGILQRELGLEAGRVALPALPAFILCFLAAGCTVVLPEIHAGRLDRVSCSRLADQMRQNRVDLLLASPSICHRLAVWTLQEGVQLPSVRDIFTGGGPVTPRMARTLQDAFPRARVTAVYGSSEAEPISRLDGADILALRARTAAGAGLPVGRPVAEIEVLILKPGCGDRDFLCEDWIPWVQERGQIGEIVVRGPHVNTRYLLDLRSQPRHKIPDRGGTWHRTGDAGYVDSDGLLWLCGALSRSTPWGGRRIYPLALEAALEERGAVRECALADWDDRGKKRVTLAWAGRGDGGTESLLASLKVLGLGDLPVRQVRAIPRDARHMSKVDTQALLKLLGVRQASGSCLQPGLM